MRSFEITITEERAREILEAEASCYSEGMPGDLSFFYPQILATFPHLKDEYRHLPAWDEL
ncbi:MAG: hypothetical protein ACYSW8_29405 [Planctomycetota bacterium]|jgi:hypothetical protein